MIWYEWMLGWGMLAAVWRCDDHLTASSVPPTDDWLTVWLTESRPIALWRIPNPTTLYTIQLWNRICEEFFGGFLIFLKIKRDTNKMKKTRKIKWNYLNLFIKWNCLHSSHNTAIGMEWNGMRLHFVEEFSTQLVVFALLTSLSREGDANGGKVIPVSLLARL